VKRIGKQDLQAFFHLGKCFLRTPYHFPALLIRLVSWSLGIHLFTAVDNEIALVLDSRTSIQ